MSASDPHRSGEEDPGGSDAGAFADRLAEIGAALLVTDADRLIVRWEGAAERMFGITREQALGRTSDELGIVDIDDVVGMRKVLFERPESPVEQDMTLCRRDGTSFPGFVRYALAYGPDGNVTGTTVLILDASEAGRADVELPGPTSFAPVVEMAAKALTGTSREELLEACVRLVAAALRADLVGVITPTAGGRGLRVESGTGWEAGLVGAAGGVEGHDAAVLSPDESSDVVQLEHVPSGGVLERHGVATGLMVSIGEPGRERGVLAALSQQPRDFGDQEREFLQAIGLALSAAAEVGRVRELEARFHRASRLEAMGQLTGGIAHDFNNLLAVILNYAQFAREDIRDGADGEESIAEIEKAAKRAAELTHQLLVFSRQEAVAVEPVDLASALTDSRGLLALTLGESVVLEVEVEPGIGPVEAGPGQLEQVLLNLAANARDAMPSGGTFRIEVKDAGGGRVGPAWVRLRVSDDGVGMPPEVREKAFEPFFTTKPVGEGSGFGLATVYGIVSGMGGSIEVRSAPGEGTEFELLLPVTDDDFVDHAAVASEERPPGPPAEERRVLLVEDDEMVRRLTARLLVRGGFEVVEAAGPGEAVTAVRRLQQEEGARRGAPIDLLLTDVVMPEASGVDLALRIRELVPGITVVFMSGYTGESVPREAVYEIEAGFVEKPFTPETLLESIERAFARTADG